MKKNKLIFYWTPYIDDVATVKATYYSAIGVNKYSSLFRAKILDVFGEWKNSKYFVLNKSLFYKLNYIGFLHKFSSHGFFKSRFKYLIIFFCCFLNLKKFLNEEKPNYLIIHLVTSLPLLLNLVFDYDTKIILRISGKPKLNYLRYLFWKLALKKIYKITFPTVETLNYFKSLNIVDENKLELLYDPIIFVKQLIKNKHEKIVNLSNYYLAIGRFTKQKNFLFLIKCFEYICKNDRSIKLIILGDGEERNKLQNYINKNDLNKNIFLPGFEKNVFKYLYNCKLFILSSLWEDPGFVLLEAMYSKALVLSSDCSSGPKEILTEKNERGILFKSNDITDFMAKFDEVKKLDLNEIKKIKFNAKIYTKKFTLFYHYNALNNILENY